MLTDITLKKKSKYYHIFHHMFHLVLEEKHIEEFQPRIIIRYYKYLLI